MTVQRKGELRCVNCNALINSNTARVQYGPVWLRPSCAYKREHPDGDHLEAPPAKRPRRPQSETLL